MASLAASGFTSMRFADNLFIYTFCIRSTENGRPCPCFANRFFLIGRECCKALGNSSEWRIAGAFMFQHCPTVPRARCSAAQVALLVDLATPILIRQFVRPTLFRSDSFSGISLISALHSTAHSTAQFCARTNGGLSWNKWLEGIPRLVEVKEK